MTIKIIDLELLEEIKTICLNEEVIRITSMKVTEYFNREDHIFFAATTSGVNYLFSIYETLDLSFKEKEAENLHENFHKVFLDNELFELIPNLKKVKADLELKSMTVSNSLATGNKLLICGFSKGLCLIWDLKKILNFVFFERGFLYNFKQYLLYLDFPHNDVIQIIEVSKTNNLFFTGSIDGQIKIWKLNQESLSRNANKRVFSLDNSICNLEGLIVENETHLKPFVNVAVWSCYNNYIIAIISSKRKFNNENKKRSSSLFIYNTHTNKVIYRTEDSELNIHDECYLLEAHPKLENIILTSCDVNEVMIFDIKQRKSIFKYNLKNYFFPDLEDPMLILEGKFFGSGDKFIVSTYLGTVSFFSVFPESSFDTTYMNQFFENELTISAGNATNATNVNNNITMSNRRNRSRRVNENDQPQQIIQLQNRPALISSPTPKFVTMLEHPYPFQQPYSKLKLIKIERQMRNEGFSESIIREMLFNNYEGLDNAEEDRREECQKEILKFEEQLKKEFPERPNSNLLVVEEDDSEFNQNEIEDDDEEEKSDNNFINENSKDEESSSSIIDELDDNSLLQEVNLNINKISRSERLKNRVKKVNFIEPTDNNIRNVRATRRNLFSSNQNDNNSDNIKKILKNNKILKDDESSSLLFESETTPIKKHKKENILKKVIVEDEEEDEEEEVKIVNINSNEINSISNIVTYCYLCNYRSNELLGPFYSNKNNSKISLSHNDECNKKIYIHSICLINNEFTIKTRNSLDYEKTIKNILNKKIICFRCNYPNATVKCKGTCERYFHAYKCSTVFQNQENLICFDCLNMDYYKLSKYTSHTNNNKKNQDRLSFEQISSSIYSFYPQIKTYYYFIPQAYEDYLAKFHLKIKREIINETLFFWKYLNFISNKQITDDDSIALCYVKDISYHFTLDNCVKNGIYAKIKLIFPNSYSLFNNLSNKNSRRQKQDEIPFETEIAYFPDNDVADFLIHKDLYDQNKSLYNINSSIDKKIKVFYENTFYPGKILNSYSKEINNIYEESFFEKLEVEISYSNNTNSNIKQNTVNEVVNFSFWDIENSHVIKDQIKASEAINTKYSNYILKALQDKEYYIFHNKVELSNYPDYYELIPVLIDLNLISDRLSSHYYFTEESFVFDLDLIINNSKYYNGEGNPITTLAIKLKNDILKGKKETKDNMLLNKKREHTSIEDDYINENKRLTRNQSRNN